MTILQEILEATPIVKGGLTLMVAGWLGYQCRAIPERLMAVVRHWITRQIEIRDKNPLYEAWLELLTESAVRPGGPRTVEVRSGSGDCQGGEAGLKAGTATFWARPLGKWCLVTVSRENGSATGGYDPTRRFMIDVEVFFARRGDLSRLLAEAKRRANVLEGRQIVELTDRYGSRHTMMMPRRDPATLCLPGGFFEGLERRVREFLGSREQYERVGVPWRLGILLHGEPGTGKTSIAHALASQLGMRLCVIPLGDFRSDEDMVSAFAQVAERTIVLIEDVDCAFKSRGGQGAGASGPGVPGLEGISFSGFLNCIDGVLAPHDGRVLLMTTNHVDRLDPALVRPGRADIRLEAPLLTARAAEDFVDRVFPHLAARHELVREVMAMEKPTPAVLLNRIMKERWRVGEVGASEVEPLSELEAIDDGVKHRHRIEVLKDRLGLER